MGYGLVNGFIVHLYTSLGTTSSFSSIANLHTLQITTAPAKPSPSFLCPQQPFPSDRFQQWRFFSYLCLCHYCPTNIPHLNTFTNQLLHFTQLNCTQPAWGPRYIDSEWTQQKISPPAIPLLLLWLVASSSSGTLNVFTSCYQARHVPTCGRCIAAVLHITICRSSRK
jgi:hypothetical protein